VTTDGRPEASRFLSRASHLAHGRTGTGRARRRARRGRDLLEELDELADIVDTHEERTQVHETRRVARRLSTPTVFGRVVTGFGRVLAAEALVGGVVFSIPMLVEDGVLEIGEYLAVRPGYYLATVGFAVSIVVGLLYVADIHDVRIVDPFFGVFPRRLVGVLSISFLTALGLMTIWGRVDWADPWLALCQVTVTFSAMSIGAALGDILPGS
jgi:uncharacterized membrane protein